MELNSITEKFLKAFAFDLESILCYGSFATGLHDVQSDIDLLILTKQNIPSIDERQKSYAQIPEVKILSLDNADKNTHDWDISWSPINDKLQLRNRTIEIGYNTTAWVERVIDALIVQNKITFPEFPFRPYTFLGLLETSQLLYDKNNFIQNCKLRIRPMPQGLQREIIRAFWPMLCESYHDLQDTASRNVGILAFQFFLTRALDAAIQLLFVINEVYDPASKRTEPILLALKKLPPNTAQFLEETLPRFYEKKEAVCIFFAELIQWIKDRKEITNNVINHLFST